MISWFIILSTAYFGVGEPFVQPYALVNEDQIHLRYREDCEEQLKLINQKQPDWEVRFSESIESDWMALYLEYKTADNIECMSCIRIAVS